MNRARLAQLTALVATVFVGGSVFSIYRPEVGVTAADYADAGVAAGNRVATCPVRVDAACAAQFGVGRYETVRFPVFRNVASDGGIEILLPPRITKAARCLEVMEWTQCDLDSNATYPGVAAKWDDAVPLTLARAASKFVVPDCRTGGVWNDAHAPVDCNATGVYGLPDGGPTWRGCNIIPRASSIGVACLDAPSAVVNSGERLEDAL